MGVCVWGGWDEGGYVATEDKDKSLSLRFFPPKRHNQAFVLRESCPRLGQKTEIAGEMCSLVGPGLREVGVGWNLGTGGGISRGQVEEYPFHAAGKAVQMCRACRWGGRKTRASFPDHLYFLCEVGGEVIP